MTAFKNLTHDNGHIWEDLRGWKGDPHGSPLHLASNALIGGGFIVLSMA